MWHWASYHYCKYFLFWELIPLHILEKPFLFRVLVEFRASQYSSNKSSFFHKFKLFLIICNQNSFFNLFFNWRKTALQWLISVQQCESAIIIHISLPHEPPSSSSHPSRSSQCTELTLCAIQQLTHGSVYTVMLFPPLVPLSPSPTVSTNLFSPPAFPFLPCK